ncbi:MAG: peptidylprolyl isomerase [Rickettsiaceae bacterium]|nr:peptidylprolyl isomerase [Rickettsiaceae bacterium]
MNKILKIFVASTAIYLNVFPAYGAETSSTKVEAPKEAQDQKPTEKISKITGATVVAEYNNGTKVTVDEVMRHFSAIFDQQPEFKGKKFTDFDENIQESLIKGYVNSKLILLEVESQKIMESAEYAKKLAEVKSQLAQQMIIENMIKEKVTDSDVRAEYEKFKKELAERSKDELEYRTAHIFLPDEAKAKEANAKLSKGAKFEDLVAEYSTDPSTKNNGGDLGFSTKGQFDPEYEAKTRTLKKGQISDPVKSQLGWHIIKLLDTRPVQPPSLTEISPQIKSKLAKDAVTTYIKDLDAKYKAKFFDLN